MMDTFPSRDDQRAAWAFASVGALAFSFYSYIVRCIKSYILTGHISSANHDAQWVQASATGTNSTIRTVSLFSMINYNLNPFTYKIPRLNTTSIPHLCLFGSCNFHNNGNGIINITRSVAVWSAALVNQTGAAGRHFARRTSSYGLQKE